MYKVFLVDDEPFILEGLYDLLDWSQFEMEIVGQAEHGQMALEALATKPVDVLITDISMPVMNGLSLIREARKLHPDLKVIILSGFNEFDYLKEGMQLGIENYLLKPINVEELESTLRNTVAKLDSSKSDQLYDDYSIQILKDNTLYRWLTQQIAESELAQRAELLGISFERPFIRIAVLRPEGSTTDIFRQVHQQFSNEDQVTQFRDVDGDIIIVAALANEAVDGQKLFRQLEELADRLRDQGQAVRIGVSRVGMLPDESAICYSEAKKSMEYFMIFPDRYLMDYASLESAGERTGAGFPIQWRDYAKLIIARDHGALAARILSDFGQLQLQSGIRPYELQHAALELIIRFKMELESIKHTDESELYQLFLGRIRECTSFEELVRALQDAAQVTINSLLQDMKNPIVNQVLSYIAVHYAAELSLKTLGAQYHLHPVYLGQLFHKETGETFAEYINRYRIERAKEQLKNTNLKVHEIARNVGYWETGYFYKQFRKYVGISPTDYKGLS
ncbi:response regulator transcription factor [Paenibacillus zeisoli]|uniref:Response regulator transcription factor n=1 Tax=Paenibacillus zeisoli TaxID=2496267 RepID=A0A3S1BBE4_9BACL|nr:response regulator transcription factor [Paenibacillus zeisoli]RUT36498.1 response regulator transcription factor [Paenibacillus zeisoli]